MDPASRQDEVVNMTRAIQALSPWLNNPRRTIVQVEVLVVTAAALLLLQLIFGHCKRRWHNSFVKGVHLVCNAVTFPLIIYTLSMMQSSPIKNSSYPVWAVFLIMASDGAVAVQKYNFYRSTLKKYGLAAIEFFRYSFYFVVLLLLMTPVTWKESWTNMHAIRFSSESSIWVQFLIVVIFMKKLYIEGMMFLVLEGRDLMRCRAVAKHMRLETWAHDHPSDSNPESMKGYKYLVEQYPSFVTIDQIWDCCGTSDDGKALKDICLSFTLHQLLKRRYLGFACAEAGHPKTRQFVFEKLLPDEKDYHRLFRIVEVELGFCYDYFFTRYGFLYTLASFGKWSPFFLILFLALLAIKIICISAVGVYAFRKSLVLETIYPIIEVHSTSTDYSITLLVIGIALIVQLLQVAFFLASDWVQVSLACRYVKSNCYGPNACLGKAIGFLRRVTISGACAKKIKQRSILFRKLELGSREVSDTVKKAIASSLIKSTDGILTNGKESLKQNPNFSWTLQNHSQLEIMLIWHVATEYCALSEDHIKGFTRGAAVILSRYSAYLIESVPELLPYHEVDIKESLRELVEDEEISEDPRSYENLKIVDGTDTEDNPTTIFKKGMKLGKQLESMPDGAHWKVMEEFWAEALIYVAPSHSTTKQHMKHLEHGGEFLTLIWALLSHAGILNLKRDKDQGTPEAAETA